MILAYLIALQSFTSYAPQAFAQSTTEASAEESSFITLINGFRSKLKLQSVVSDERLVDAARNHAIFMSNYHVLTHNGPKPWWGSGTRMRVAGIPNGVLTGENIARGSFSARNTFIQWFFSEEHLQGMLTREYDHIGVARAGCDSEEYQNSCFWVTDFAQLKELPDAQSQLDPIEPSRAEILKAGEAVVGAFESQKRDTFLNPAVVTEEPVRRRGIFKYLPQRTE